MKSLRLTMLILFMAAALSSCAVMSNQIRQEAQPAIPFKDLLQNPNAYIGKTVILGGYILDTMNVPNETLITVLETPLSYNEEPKSKDYSQGRFIIAYKGFLDPAVYKKDRMITVGGTFVGIVMKDVEKAPHAFPKIESRQLYLWPEYQYNYGVAPYWGWGIPYYPIAPYPFNPYPYWSPFWY